MNSDQLIKERGKWKRRKTEWRIRKKPENQNKQKQFPLSCRGFLLPFEIYLRWKVIPHEEKDSLAGSRGDLLLWQRGLGGSCTSEFVVIYKEKSLRGSQRCTWNNPTNDCTRICSCADTNMKHPRFMCKNRQELIPRSSGAGGVPLDLGYPGFAWKGEVWPTRAACSAWLSPASPGVK